MTTFQKSLSNLKCRNFTDCLFPASYRPLTYLLPRHIVNASPLRYRNNNKIRATYRIINLNNTFGVVLPLTVKARVF